MLVEFETEKEASNLICSGCFSDGLDVIPVQSSFLWFRSAKNKNSKRRLSDLMNLSVPPAILELATKNGCQIPSEAEVSESLMKSNSLSHQIANLYEMTRLDDLGIRLRYMVARQVRIKPCTTKKMVNLHHIQDPKKIFFFQSKHLDFVLNFFQLCFIF